MNLLFLVQVLQLVVVDLAALQLHHPHLIRIVVVQNNLLLSLLLLDVLLHLHHLLLCKLQSLHLDPQRLHASLLLTRGRCRGYWGERNYRIRAAL